MSNIPQIHCEGSGQEGRHWPPKDLFIVCKMCGRSMLGRMELKMVPEHTRVDVEELIDRIEAGEQ